MGTRIVFWVAEGKVGRIVGATLLLTSLLLGAMTSTVVRAASVAVNDTSDTIHGCSTSGTGTCSLRDAILYTNSISGLSVSLPAGSYTLTMPPMYQNNQTIGGALHIAANTTVMGAGADKTIIQASTTSASEAKDRVVVVGDTRMPSTTVAITGVTIRYGRSGGIQHVGGALTINDSIVASNQGHGIDVFPSSTLVLNNTTVRDNTPTDLSSDSGGISNNGTTTINNSTISGNVSKREAGGIDNSGTLTLVGSTVSGNTASVGGAGISNRGRITAINSTISSNNTQGNGGGVYNLNKIEFSSVTIANNSSGIYNESNKDSSQGKTFSSTATIANTLLANGGANCAGSGTFASGNYNLSSDTSCSGAFVGSHDLNAIDPKISPLGSNGGPTQTHVLLAGSPALDQIPASGANCPQTDQRGVTSARIGMRYRCF